MKNDLATKISRLIPGTRASGGGPWYSLPECPSCGKKRKFYFNEVRGFKCFAGSCQIRGTTKTLIKLLASHGYAIDYSTEPREDAVLECSGPPAPIVEKEPEQLVSVPLPHNVLPITKDRIPKAFAERGFPYKLMAELGFECCIGGLYANRIIVPLLTNGNSAFLAYCTKPQVQFPKVLYPPGCEISRFLFPWQMVVQIQPKRLLICEGVTDALRAIIHYRHGSKYFPAALMGKCLSRNQLRIIVGYVKEHDVEEVLCMLDGDATEDNEVMAKRLTGELGSDTVTILDWRSVPTDLIESIARVGFTYRDVDPGLIKSYNHWREILRYSRRA